MSDRVLVEICTGTTCFVMGGSELLMLEEHLSDSIKKKVEIKGTPCMEHCKKNPAADSPYVMVNKKLIKQATVYKVVNEIKRLEGDYECS